VRIRNATKENRKSFVKIYSEAYSNLEEYAYRSNKETKRYFNWLFQRDPDGFFVAEIGEPVGFIACDANWFSFEGDGDSGEIHELFVKPEYQRRGIGKNLLLHGIKYLENMGKKRVGLWVGIKNTVAIDFYRKMGFKKGECWGKWLRMVLRL